MMVTVRPGVLGWPQGLLKGKGCGEAPEKGTKRWMDVIGGVWAVIQERNW